MADLTDVYAALQKADAAGDTAGAKQLADYIRTQSATSGRNAYSPTNSGNTLQVGPIDTGIPISAGVENFLAGAGKSTSDLVRGAGQFLGLQSRGDIEESRRIDAPLMATGAGKAGLLTGSIANLLPAAFIPGANTLAGAGAIGAASGLAQPSINTKETLSNALLGGILSPAGILAGRGAGALYQGVKSTLEPLFQGGQERVAARTLQSFAGGEAQAAQAAATLGRPGPSILPSVQPTTAELANNAGLSQLERTLRNNPEYLQALTARNQANRGAMVSAVQRVAGTDADMAAAQATRTNATAPLYVAARDATAQSDPALTELLGRPSMQGAWSRAQQIAAERGDKLVSGRDIPEHVVNSSVLDESGKPFSQTVPAQTATYSGRAIQYLKMALNDVANTGPQSGMGAHEASAVKSTLGSLNDWIQANVPALKAADARYAQMSAPINQMEVGQALSDKLLPALSDFGNNTRLNASSFAKAMRNGDVLASQVTGQKNATLAGVLSQDQLRSLIQVGQQLGRRANADELGRAVGSNTGQNLISQNVLRQILGPLGLPESMTERAAQSAFGQSVLRPTQWLLKAGEPRVMDKLAEAALNPTVAKNLLEQQQQRAIAQALWDRQGLAGILGPSVAYPSQQ